MRKACDCNSFGARCYKNTSTLKAPMSCNVWPFSIAVTGYDTDGKRRGDELGGRGLSPAVMHSFETAHRLPEGSKSTQLLFPSRSLASRSTIFRDCQNRDGKISVNRPRAVIGFHRISVPSFPLYAGESSPCRVPGTRCQCDSVPGAFFSAFA